MNSVQPNRVAIYTRLSSDRTGDGLAVARQETLCRQFCSDRGWHVQEVLSDNDVSATSGVARPAFERLLAGLADGTYTGVVAYHADRLYRSIRDLGRLLDLHKAQPFTMATLTGDLDLGTDTGRMMAGILASVAAAEVERKNTRQKDANRQRALAGKTLSKSRVFGWEPDHSTLRQSESGEIAAAVQGLIAGTTSLTKIATRWSALGLTTEQRINKKGLPSSPVWSAAKVRGILQRQRNCGRAIYQGSVVGVGQWQPIVSEEDHDLLQGIFAGRSVSRDNRRVHPISGLPECGICGERLFLDKINKKDNYVCKKTGHLGIVAEYLDDYLLDWFTSELANPRSRTVKRLSLEDTMNQIRFVREKLAKLTAEETELGESDLPVATIKARGGKLLKQRQELESQLVSLISGDRVIQLVEGLTPFYALEWGKIKERQKIVLDRFQALDAKEQFIILTAVCRVVVSPVGDKTGSYKQRARKRIKIYVDGVEVE